ncbi:efflux RND transporter periplasmic adaptor subunit [Phyllobacterium sp. 21LDTY02-6]|uniref:efflux RND transporter periplasmic adaptor subunit n=1 Tax=unclassified Phyllobacterium TaxID=2638441 RepID=UPI0020225385|nr:MULTISPECIES: efflux RND transporter periplasmic adaptor subunit [unclassified Phyllobacterium]MCO4318056.1 efflux RND transporter periplasmic adaptor subunit [Phyllobacterium sp. 21LDTY02-6]MCX8280050.1 efflux RND transporter periplasmic adaptor subunit [Phyllobacterium sp. 0TCS1.6C]MCX8294388.1 efflux RND transporter periplasmic adaptor subunit [Phyllobacterium sp. 0TCS1.6A]
MNATRFAFALFLPLLAAACSDSQSSAEKAAPPPSPVSFIAVKAEPIPINNELPGRIAPTRIAEVRPRVSGIVVERVFEQGSLVNEGDVLYRIDPAQFQVQVQSAEATLLRAKSVQLQSRQQADRQQSLKSSNFASAQALDNAVAAVAQADADVAGAEANLAAAKLNLQYADVRAPIKGRIGRALITEGALVSANSTENLATIQQLDPVYADFTQSSNELIRLRKALAAGAIASAGEGAARVKLKLDDGSEYKHAGKLLFSEAAVDETTGQVTLRGEFPNPDGDLLPGMYVRVEIEQGVQQNAIAVPQQAIQRDTGGNAQVYIVGEKDVAELRSVRVGRVVGERIIVDEGLEPANRVIVEGFQKIRPGATVAPSEWVKGGAASVENDRSKTPATKPRQG